MNTDGRRGSVRPEQLTTDGKPAPGTRWRYVVDVSLPGGPRKQAQKRGFATKKAAQAALTKLLEEVRTQTYVAPTKQTLAGFIEETWLPAIEATIRPSTYDSYRRNLKLHVCAMPIGHVQLQELVPPMLNVLYAQLLAGDEAHRKLAARSVSYVHVILHRVFRDAMKWNLLMRNPADAADPPRSRPNESGAMRTWTAAELGTFLQAEPNDRLQALWWLLASTGMRRGEAVGLRWEDVDTDGATLSINRTLVTTDARRAGDPGMAWSTPKTAKGRRSVALDATTVTILKGHKARQAEERLAIGAGYQDEGLVFALPDGSPIHPKTVSYYFDRRVKRLGVPRIRLHDLRHTHATLALQAGVHPKVVQERLGHANIGITLDTYSHVTPAMQSEAAERVAALLTVSN
jgi:integrase